MKQYLEPTKVNTRSNVIDQSHPQISAFCTTRREKFLKRNIVQVADVFLTCCIILIASGNTVDCHIPSSSIGWITVRTENLQQFNETTNDKKQSNYDNIKNEQHGNSELSSTSDDQTIATKETSSSTATSTTEESSSSSSSTVGLKDRRSNAVGDPDDDDDDDDDEDEHNNDDSFAEWEELFDTIEAQLEKQTDVNDNSIAQDDDDNNKENPAQLQLEVKYVAKEEEAEDGGENEKSIKLSLSEPSAKTMERDVTDMTPLDNNEKESIVDSSGSNIEYYDPQEEPQPSGGLGIRFGQRRNHNQNNNNRSNPRNQRRGGGIGRVDSKERKKKDILLVDNDDGRTMALIGTGGVRLDSDRTTDETYVATWQSFIYFPPPAASLQYLKDNARSIDVASKIRLDRRTLYAGLLQEWNSGSLLFNKTAEATSTATTTTKNTAKFKNTNLNNSRKYLDPSTSQALQAALSLATQPAWRKSFPRTTGIRLYNIDDHQQQQQLDHTTHESSTNDNLGSSASLEENHIPSNLVTSTAKVNHRGCTLAMQETIAMALAHSLGSAYVVLDDRILMEVRSELVKRGLVTREVDIKPVTLIKSLINMARDGKLGTFPLPVSSSTTHTKTTTEPSGRKDSSTALDSNNTNTPIRRRSASIAKAMEIDLKSGLDDPFDERATASCEEMALWEETWFVDDQESIDGTPVPIDGTKHSPPLPLVIFLRTDASRLLLKSKSAVEFLLKECESTESTNLLVLAKGVDATTETLPPVERKGSRSSSDSLREMSIQSHQNLPGAAPWFGFTPHNQNASGQNDPEGSRRFNIFLSRTTDPKTGDPGIVGAIAPPQAGNLFPHMMALQARARFQQQQNEKSTIDQDDDQTDSPMRAELEKWANLLQNQMQTSGGNPLPPAQFFNATFTISNSDEKGQTSPGLPSGVTLPPDVIQQALEHAMAGLFDRLAQVNEDEISSISENLSPELHKAFTQVLRNENFRKGIAENLARAAPVLSDPKCQGVLLSVYVPPPQIMNRSVTPSPEQKQKSQEVNEQQQHQLSQESQQGEKMMGGWFQKLLNSQGENGVESTANGRQKRVRTMAAAAAVMAAQNAQKKKASKDTEDADTGSTDVNRHDDKAERHLAKLESICRPIIVNTPTDPVRSKSWEAWIARECGAIIFRHNRRALVKQLEKHSLALQEHTGTSGAGSALRSMLSVRPIADEMQTVIERAVELEAAKCQRQHQSPTQIHTNEMNLDVDITLSQLLVTEFCIMETEELLPVTTSDAAKSRTENAGIQFIHPSSLEAAITMVCRISPSPSGGTVFAAGATSSTVAHRTREEISALAQDKHERALVSQVVSPQDIGVTYDMIGGLTEVKELLRQSITYPLKFPHLYSEGIAREAVKGVLLFGPPGTGKTMLAKAVATEGGASFLSVDASSVENKWLGESEKNAKAVFTLARRLAPCVIFIDEVDSLLSSREGTSDDSAHGTLTSVKTTMMSEWDGLNSGTNGSGEAGSDRVIVIGSTNRPFDLDEAVLRRFPRRILVDLPDLATRTEILEVTLAENRLDPSVNLTKIAERLEGYTGSDIKEVCREAVVQISHEQAKILDQGLWSNSKEGDVTQGSLQRLRPVTNDDFQKALSKLKRSVSEKGRELARVWEWNDEYGEIKKEKKNYFPHLANMYL